MRMLNQGEEEDHPLLNLILMIPLDTMNEWKGWTIEDTGIKKMKRMKKERNHHYDWEIIEIRHGRAFVQREEHDENEELWRLILVSLPRWGGVTTGEEEGTTGGEGGGTSRERLRKTSREAWRREEDGDGYRREERRRGGGFGMNNDHIWRDSC